MNHNIFIEIKRISVVSLKIILLMLGNRFSKKVSNRVVLLAEFGSRGGAYTYFKQLYRFFEDEGFEVVLLTTDDQAKILEEDFTSFSYKPISISTPIWCPYFKRSNGLEKNLQYLSVQLRELHFFLKVQKRTKPDAFYFSITCPGLYFPEFLLPGKVYFILHTLTHHGIDRLKNYLLNITLSLSKRKIIVVSYHAKDILFRNWRIKQRNKEALHVVYNYHEDSNEISKDLIFPNNLPVQILTLGNVVHYKNPEFWCDLAIDISQKIGTEKVKFTWLGDGALRENCLNKVSGFPNIEFPGHISDVHSYYQKADIYVQPSSTESLGIAVLGAMAYKVPCVVSRVGGMMETVKDGENGFTVPEKDINGFSERLLQLINDPEYRRHLGENGLSKFKSQFTKKVWVKKMKNIVKS